MFKVLLSSFDLQNEMIRNALQEELGPLLFAKLQIEVLPLKGLSTLKVADRLIEIIDEVEILVVYEAPVTNKVIEAGKKLKLIVSARGGPVNIDIKTARNQGILVSNAPGHNAEAVADHAFALLLAEVKNIVTGDKAVRNGLWASLKDKLAFQSFEISGKTIGVVGFGNIGPLIAKRAKGFGMRILVYDPYVPEKKIQSCCGEKVDFDTLLRESDLITIHVRLTPETFHLFGEKQFALMKPSAILVNVSRGPIIDEDALYESLKGRRIAGAGLDVFEEEPIAADHPLCTLENVILTPHIAYVGTDYHRGSKMVAEEINLYLRGEPLKYVVNSDSYLFERNV